MVQVDRKAQDRFSWRRLVWDATAEGQINTRKSVRDLKRFINISYSSKIYEN